MDEVNRIKDKLFESIDPNTSYTIEDFEKEFGSDWVTTSTANSYSIPLNFANTSTNEDTDNGKNDNPEYAKDGDSGFDVRANLDKPIVLRPARVEVIRYMTNLIHASNIEDIEFHVGETKVIPTGLFFEIPRGYEIQVRSRSGLAAKAHLNVLNSPGTIDSGYRGELQIILTNHGHEPFTVNNGDRIAQCVFASVLDNNIVELQEVDEVSKDTDRGEGKFGSTGVE